MSTQPQFLVPYQADPTSEQAPILISPTRAVNIRQVPEAIWRTARHQALASRLPFKTFVIRRLAESSSLALKSRPSAVTLRAAGPRRTINVRGVPDEVWARAHRNAVDSGLTLREYVLEILQMPLNHSCLAFSANKQN